MANYGQNISFNPLLTDYSKPNPNVTGKDTANRLGMIYDYSVLQDLFTQAVASGTKLSEEQYKNIIAQFYQQMAAQQATQQAALSKAEAEGAVNNSSAGLVNTNKLTNLLGSSQAFSQEAADLARQQMLIADQNAANMSQANVDALNQYNNMAAILGQIINEMNAVQAQAYAPELGLEGLLAQLAENGLLGGGGGGKPTTTITDSKVPTGAGPDYRTPDGNGNLTVDIENFTPTGGRYYDAFIRDAATMGKINEDLFYMAQIYTQNMDYKERTGRDNANLVNLLGDYAERNPNKDMYGLTEQLVVTSVLDAENNYTKNKDGVFERTGNVNINNVGNIAPSLEMFGYTNGNDRMLTDAQQRTNNNAILEVLRNGDFFNLNSTASKQNLSDNYINTLREQLGEKRTNAFLEALGDGKMITKNGAVVNNPGVIETKPGKFVDRNDYIDKQVKSTQLGNDRQEMFANAQEVPNSLWSKLFGGKGYTEAGNQPILSPTRLGDLFFNDMDKNKNKHKVKNNAKSVNSSMIAAANQQRAQQALANTPVKTKSGFIQGPSKNTGVLDRKIVV